jgi:ketosteroid isomerase-like protein
LARVPSENVEIVKRGFAAFDQGGVEALLEFIHEDFEASTPPGLASEPDTYVGHDGVRRYFDSFNEVMEDIRWESHSFREVGDKVVVEFTLYARGRSTGLEFGQPAVQVWTLRDGKGIGLELYPTLEEALAAAGDEGRSA